MQLIPNRVSVVARRSAWLLVAAAALVALPEQAAAQNDIVLQAASARTRSGSWVVARDTGAIGGSVMRNANRNARKIVRASASPRDYFELTFQAQANTPYRLWLRGHAKSNYWGNDSVFAQFDRSVTSSGAATFRIGTTSATEVNLESCSGCGVRGWVWQDNGYGRNTLGPLIRFSRSGTQRIRIQTREDGLSIDQIVLSPSRYLRTAPTRSASAAPATPAPAPATPAPAAPRPPTGGSTSGGGSSNNSSTLKVLDWNIHHGVGTDGRYDIDRIATGIAATGANVVSLNEVERFTGWGNEDQPARFAALLRAKTGKRWNYNFAQNSGNARGQGNLLLTTFDIESEDDGELSHTRSVARIGIVVRGVRVNIFSTHLDPNSSSRRAQQMRELKAWAGRFPEQRILVGDFNAWPGASEIGNMTSSHTDAWAASQRAGHAVAYSGNSAGNTRNSRIDYIFYSKAASRLRHTQTRVFDKRNSRGVMPSDHRPVMATFTIR